MATDGETVAEAIARFEREPAARREAAAAAGRPWVEPLDLGVTWNAGAPMPHLVVGPHRAFVICYPRDSENLRALGGWGESEGRPVTSGDEEALLVVEIVGCSEVRWGGPNDEAQHGHPLAGSGLSGYGPFEVHNSAWIEHSRQVNSVHEYHSDDVFRSRRHFILAFHDEMIETQARRLDIEVRHSTMRDLLTELAVRVTES
ncbi:hypothetical protein ACIB24_20480 [Spongisporangium articulatum]|uniref:Uncharacterized protein n=1 Tax=Spongisporangium articulatum TaxID=3362603 RepID=A0ABW8ATY0_9ACTN